MQLRAFGAEALWLAGAAGATTLALAAVLLGHWVRRREAARLRRDIVAGISHDLRTPLTQIELFSDMLLAGAAAEGDRERWLRVVRREAHQLGYRVENLIFFADVGRAPPVLVRRPTELAGLVGEVAGAFAAAAAARGVSLVADAPLGVTAEVDARALTQALANLVDNAIRFGPSGQTVRVALRAERGMAVLTVTDQGGGVPARERRRVWKPLARRAVAGERMDGGGGIGLAVVRAVARAHGGRAAVDDAPGGGARFTLTLPLDCTDSPQSAPSPRRTENSKFSLRRRRGR